MRSLIYVPIIHMSGDLGSIAKDITKRGIADLGEEFWREHMKTVEGFWDAVSLYFDSINVSGMKIYQDGMMVAGELGQKIIEEGIKSKSKNYELIQKLLDRGATLMVSEDFKLIKEEYDRLISITRAKSTFSKVTAFIRYKPTKNILLNKRDKFIAKRIDETLGDGETGIIFIGAYHNLRKRLPCDIQIKEIKNCGSLREYQKLLPFHKIYKERFEDLKRYLVSRVET